MGSLWVSHFNIVGGEVQQEGPWLAAFPDRSHGDTKPSDLYLVVEPALPGSEELCAQLVAAIGKLFHQRKLSLTGGLLWALRAAHEQMRDWNRKSLKEHRVAAGTSCLALCGSEAYLAQVGPTIAYLRLQDGLRRIQPHIPNAQEPLGLYAEFWPAFSRYELSAGDRVLLATSNLAAAVGDQEVKAALALRAEECLAPLYQQARHLSDCGALLLTLAEDDEA